MTAAARASVAVLLSAITISAQSRPEAPFEVASVKLVAASGPPAKPLMCGLGAGGRFQAYGWVRYFVACAYQTGFGKIDDFILGGPSWIDAEFYQIDAKLPGSGVRPTQADGFAAFRALLAERFKFAAHHGSQKVVGYALVAAKRPGPRLRRADPACVGTSCGRDTLGPSTIVSRAMTMPQLAKLLSSRVGRPVEDRTGLEGAYDLALEWKPTLTALPLAEEGSPDFLPADPVASPLFGALESQLGLKLESHDSTIDVILIDHVDRPTPN